MFYCHDVMLMLGNVCISTICMKYVYQSSYIVRVCCCKRKNPKKRNNYVCPINFRMDEIFAEFFLSSEYYMLSFRHIGPCDIQMANLGKSINLGPIKSCYWQYILLGSSSMPIRVKQKPRFFDKRMLWACRHSLSSREQMFRMIFYS